MECGRTLTDCVTGKSASTREFIESELNLMFQIVHVILNVQMVVLIARTQFAYVAKMHHLKIRTIWKTAKKKKASTWASV